MLHLPSERLAELADAPEGAGAFGSLAEGEELAHLASCAICTRELASYRRLVSVAADERLRIAPPLTEWGQLSSALRSEQLITSPAIPARIETGARRLTGFRRAAAALLLVGAGAVAGRASSSISFRANGASFGSANPAAAPDALDPNAVANAQLVSNGGEAFASPQAALASLERAQREYEAAATYLATHDTTSLGSASEQYRTRLAALDRTAETMQAALREAPQDPLINQYYMATMNAREVTLRRLGTVMPVGNRLGRF